MHRDVTSGFAGTRNSGTSLNSQTYIRSLRQYGCTLVTLVKIIFAITWNISKVWDTRSVTVEQNLTRNLFKLSDFFTQKA